MNAWNFNLQMLARGGMELSWRYAWVLFVALLTPQVAFPLPAAVAALTMGAVLSRMSAAGRLRNYQKIALQTGGFILAGLPICYWIRYFHTPFWDFHWLRHLLLEPKNLPQWSLLLVSMFFVWLFWQGGRLLIKGPHGYLPICMQFDKGLGLLMLLLVAYALVDVRTELDLQNRGIRFAILAYFTFSLTSIALSRHHTQAHKAFVRGYHGIGVILSFLTMAALFTAGIGLLAYPYVFDRADVLLVLLQDTARPLTPLLIKLLILLFRPRNLKLEGDVPAENSLALEAMDAPVAEGWQAVLLNTIGTGLILLIALAALSIMGVLCFKLTQWLLKKDRDAAAPLHLFGTLKRCVTAIRTLCKKAWIKIAAMIKRVDSAARVYDRLLRWGRYSGVSANPCDTPSEYRRRLVRRFPDLAGRINMIVEAFNQETYGRARVSGKDLARLASVQRSMRRLKYWPSRLQSWWRL